MKRIGDYYGFTSWPPDADGRRWTRDELDALKGVLNRTGYQQVSDAIASVEFDAVELKHEVARLKAELAAGQVRELRYRDALEEARDDVADGVNQMINCGWEKEWRIEKAKEQLAYIDYLLTLPTDNSELRAVCLRVANRVFCYGDKVPVVDHEAIVNEVIGK